ncbi:hypothetical protein GCM10011610_42040 [Nocardia rhizosphaerihabitans]|uniref:Uncharacterized protein n=1 Tax=Nocardia rhizosphaerihabitans TaxID=1691570 RepID=A0ABQ2KKX3_9NOCA|nr:hypothetical protein GCM10011610_42040 [Nocardia rhizosphaerihabitans]
MPQRTTLVTYRFGPPVSSREAPPKIVSGRSDAIDKTWPRQGLAKRAPPHGCAGTGSGADDSTRLRVRSIAGNTATPIVHNDEARARLIRGGWGYDTGADDVVCTGNG